MNGYVFAILATALYSPVGVLTKLTGDAVHPMTLNFYRIFFAFMTLLIVMPRIDKDTFKIERKDIKSYVFVGLLLSIGMLLHTLAFAHGTVTNAIVLMYTYPMFVMFLGTFILKEEITFKKIVSFFLAFGGIIILNPFEFGFKISGDLLALIAALFSAFITVAYKKEGQKSTIKNIFWYLLFGSIFMLPLPFIYGFGEFSFVFIYIILMGVFTGAYHLLINISLKTIESYYASIVDLIVSPMISILLAVLIINETVSMRLLIAGSLIIGSGLYLTNHRRELAIESLRQIKKIGHGIGKAAVIAVTSSIYLAKKTGHNSRVAAQNAVRSILRNADHISYETGLIVRHFLMKSKDIPRHAIEDVIEDSEKKEYAYHEDQISAIKPEKIFPAENENLKKIKESIGKISVAGVTATFKAAKKSEKNMEHLISETAEKIIRNADKMGIEAGLIVRKSLLKASHLPTDLMKRIIIDTSVRLVKGIKYSAVKTLLYTSSLPRTIVDKILHKTRADIRKTHFFRK